MCVSVRESGGRADGALAALSGLEVVVRVEMRSRENESMSEYYARVVCMYVCMYVCMHLRVCMCEYISVYVCVCVCV